MIKYFRVQKGLTQDELARRVGTTQSTISKLEKKESYRCDIQNLFLPLSKELDICPFILGLWLTNIRIGDVIKREEILTFKKQCNKCPHLDCSVREHTSNIIERLG